MKDELCLSQDPRYNFPVPLSVALEFLRQEVGMRNQSNSWSVKLEIESKTSFPAGFVIEPAIVRAVGAFIVEYGLYHGIKNLALNIIFQKSPIPCIELQTNIKRRELWFVLDDQSPAQNAKNHLVEILNHYTAKGTIFTSTQDSQGCLLFQVSVRCVPDTETTWKNVEQTLGQDTRFLAQGAWSESSHRVYRNNDLIHKVQLIGQHNVKPLILAEEYNILRRLEGIEGVPHFPSYKQYADFAVLSYKKVPGMPISEYLANCKFDRKAWFRCIADLSILMHNIHKRGVLHRDLNPENILVQENGRVCLIDFDQAVAGVYGGQQVDTKGKRFGVIPQGVPVGEMIDLLGFRDKYWMVVKELRSAWRIAARSNASSPGRNLAYHRWVFGDVELPGERDWLSRWDIMYKALRQFLPGARVLDLGCNMGLLATHCMLYGAKCVTAVDVHDDILEAGRTLARAAGVNVDFLKGDLDSHDFVNSILCMQYDLVIALSVVHWLEHPDEALRLLAFAPMVLFEGHNPPSVEINLLRGLGFEDVKLIGYSERLRGLYLAGGRT
jgi:predicted Ser/Thr protein kinase